MLEDDFAAYDADGLRASLSTSFDKVAKVLDERGAAKMAFVSQLSRHVQLGTVDWSDCRAPWCCRIFIAETWCHSMWAWILFYSSANCRDMICALGAKTNGKAGVSTPVFDLNPFSEIYTTHFRDVCTRPVSNL